MNKAQIILLHIKVFPWENNIIESKNNQVPSGEMLFPVARKKLPCNLSLLLLIAVLYSVGTCSFRPLLSNARRPSSFAHPKLLCHGGSYLPRVRGRILLEDTAVVANLVTVDHETIADHEI